MRLWLNRTAAVSLREQLITQVVLGIVSNELRPVGPRHLSMVHLR
jgi:hypothetical protein